MLYFLKHVYGVAAYVQYEKYVLRNAMHDWIDGMGWGRLVYFSMVRMSSHCLTPSVRLRGTLCLTTTYQSMDLIVAFLFYLQSLSD